MNFGEYGLPGANTIITPVVFPISSTAVGQSITVSGTSSTYHNTGSNQMGIRDQNGVLIATVSAGGNTTVTFDASNNTWSVSGTNLSPILWLQSNTVISGGLTHAPVGIIQLSTNLAVFVTTNAGNIFGTAYDMTNGALGTTTQILAGGVGNVVTNGLITLDATHGLIVGDTFMVCFSVAALVITPGAGVAATATAVSATALTATSFTVVSKTGTTVQARAATIAGVTITAGAAVTIFTAAGTGDTYGAPLIRSATQVLAIVGDVSSTYGFAHYTVAGSVVTANSSAVAANFFGLSANRSTYPVLMTADEWWLFIVDGATGTRVLKLTVSGTTVTLTQGTVFGGAGTQSLANIQQTVKVNATTITAFVGNPLYCTYLFGTLTGITLSNVVGGGSFGTSSNPGTGGSGALSLQSPAANSSFPNIYTGYSLTAISASTSKTILHADEAFPNTEINFRASYQTGLGGAQVTTPPLMFRFSTKDILIGIDNVTSGPNIPGVGLSLDRTSAQTSFTTFNIPAITTINNPGLYDQKVSVTASKGCILQAGGKISSFEVVL